MPTLFGKGNCSDEFLNVCYSQLGEDQIVDHFFSNVKPVSNGVYVDVGCHHPKKFSNTFGLYLKGWKGVCIDADLALVDLYKNERPNDIFINSGVGSVNRKSLTYYIFENAAANTLVPEVKNEFLKKGWKLLGEKLIPVNRLDFLLKDSPISDIHYLNIDVEGMDFDVLRSFDFSMYKPNLISIETNIRNLSEIATSPIAKFLDVYGYVPYSHCVITTFFALK